MRQLQVIAQKCYDFLVSPLYSRLRTEMGKLIAAQAHETRQEIAALDEKLQKLEKFQDIAIDYQRRFDEIVQEQESKDTERLIEISNEYQRRMSEFIVFQDKMFVKMMDEMLRLSVQISDKLETDVTPRSTCESDLSAPIV